MRYQFIAEDFSGSYWSNSDCALGRLNTRENIMVLNEGDRMSIGDTGQMWRNEMSAVKPEFKTTHVFLNGESIGDGRLTEEVYNTIKQSVINGSFRSAEVEIEAVEG